MANEPRKRKRRSNRPSALDGVSPMPAELTYYRSLRPLWDRNLKWEMEFPPLEVPSEDETGKETEMASEPRKRKRKRRSNRPAELDDVLPLPIEMTYYRSLRPLWDRNLKWEIQPEPLQVPPLPRFRQDAAGEEPDGGRDGK